MKVVLLAMLFISCVVFNSCTKPTNGQNQQTRGKLMPFEVTVLQRIPNSAIIKWTTSDNFFTADTVKYKIYLNNRLVASNLLRTTDTLHSLSKDTLYNGMVVAYIKGDSVSAPFVLEKFAAFVYFNDRFSHTMDCFSAYPSIMVNYPFWKVTVADLKGRPTLSNDTLFVAENYPDSRLKAINADSGKIIWSSPINYPLSERATLTYHAGKLITAGGVVNVINASNGERLWQSQNAYTDYDSNPVCANGKVFVGGRNAGGHLTAFDLSTGTELWNFVFNTDICARPLLVGDLVIVTTGTTKVYALKQATGKLVWTKDFSRPSDNHGAAWVSPSLAQGNIILHTHNKGFYALDPVDGAVKWLYPTVGSISSPTFGNGKLYFAKSVEIGSGGHRLKLIALNATNGTLVWENFTSFSLLFNPIFAKNNLYLQDDNIYSFNAETGANIGQVGGPVVTAHSYVVRMNNVAYYDCEHGNYKTE